LRLKHIDDGTTRALLDEVDDHDYVEQLKPMLQQKRKSTKARSDYELNLKLMKWALGRGFTMDVIRKCMDVADDEDKFLD
jgi:regulatory protein